MLTYADQSVRLQEEAAKGHGSRSGKGVRTTGTAIISNREIDREGTTHFKPKVSTRMTVLCVPEFGLDFLICARIWP